MFFNNFMDSCSLGIPKWWYGFWGEFFRGLKAEKYLLSDGWKCPEHYKYLAFIDISLFVDVYVF